jgi:general secretion pathway protein C
LNHNLGMLARWWAFVVWALVAGSALFWGLRLFVEAPQAPAQAVVAELGTGARGDLTRVFGPDPVVVEQATEPEPAADARFQLIGVVSPRGGGAGNQGLALIAVDGKPAKAYRVGSVVDGQTVLQSVQARGAALGPRGGAVQVALDIAPPVAAATGSLADLSAPTRPPSLSVPRPLPPGAPARQPPAAQYQGAPSTTPQPPGSMSPAEQR